MVVRLAVTTASPPNGAGGAVNTSSTSSTGSTSGTSGSSQQSLTGSCSTSSNSSSIGSTTGNGGGGVGGGGGYSSSSSGTFSPNSDDSPAYHNSNSSSGSSSSIGLHLQTPPPGGPAAAHYATHPLGPQQHLPQHPHHPPHLGHLPNAQQPQHLQQHQQHSQLPPPPPPALQHHNHQQHNPHGHHLAAPPPGAHHHLQHLSQHPQHHSHHHAHHQQQQQQQHAPSTQHERPLMLPYGGGVGGAEYYTGAGGAAGDAYFITHEQMCAANVMAAAGHPALCAMHPDFGPATVPMVSQGGSPPVPMPVQVPAGHVMQQMVDEHGQLRHVFLSTAHPPPPQPVGVPTHMQSHYITNNGAPAHYYTTLPAAGPPPGTGPPPPLPTHYHTHLPPHHLHQQPPLPPPPQQQQQHPSIMSSMHSPSPPTTSSSSSTAAQPSPPSNASNPALNSAGTYHKDERSQRQHNKLLRKLDAKTQQSNRKSSTEMNGLRHNNHLNHSNNNSSIINNNLHQLQHNNHNSANNHHHNQPHLNHNNVVIHHPQSHHAQHLATHHSQQQHHQHQLPPHLQSHPHQHHQQQQQQHAQHQQTHHLLHQQQQQHHHHHQQQHQQNHQQHQQHQQQLQQHHHNQLLNAAPTHLLHVAATTPSPSPHNGSGGGGLTGTGTSTTPTSGAASTASYDEDTSSLATTDDDDETLALQEQLSSVLPPIVSEVTSRTALVQWSAPVPSSQPPSPTTDTPPPSPPPPQSNITAIAVVPLNDRDLRYEVLLSDRGKEGKYKIIFKGASMTCRIRDLRPGQEYSVCLVVHLHNVHGSASEPAVFTTPGCEPDAPLPPKCISRTKNQLQLRWNAPLDNGAHIQQYLLEYDAGKGCAAAAATAATNASNADPASTADDAVVAANETAAPAFVEVIRMKGKQYSLPKLQPSTWYQFRLAAINEFGTSAYSDPITYTTAGNVPPAPAAPAVQPAATTSSTLHLHWPRRSADEDYILQIADPGSGHGFLNCYTGRDTEHECVQLRRATAYQFRLRAQNESGLSNWSDVTTAQTPPERPARPGRPALKGKTHATQFKVRWDAPADNGGAPVRLYTLQICQAPDSNEQQQPSMATVYTGPETEAICDRLQPGTTYQLRVNCEGPGGISAYSDLGVCTTEAEAPDAPGRPQCAQPPCPYTATVRWSAPAWTGGAPLTEYEVDLQQQSSPQPQQSPADDAPGTENGGGTLAAPVSVYRGRERQCVITSLQPGAAYAVLVRAYNRIGAGAWSEPLSFKAGAAAPYSPDQLEVNVAGGGAGVLLVTVSWRAPFANGSRITEYQLEAAAWPPADSSDDSSSTTPRTEQFHPCYTGAACRAEVRHLLPFTRYAFRVCARNAAGTSLYSSVASVRTPPAVPAAPHIESHRATADSIRLQWRPAEPHGAPVLYYVVEDAGSSAAATAAAGKAPADAATTTTPAGRQQYRTADAQPEWTVRQLRAETAYRYRVQAVNACGAGPFSNAVRVQTRALPPRAPRLECCQPVAHNALKLRWADGKNVDFTRFCLEMWNNRVAEFQPVYEGKLMTFKVAKLQEQQAYVFRICAESDAAGVGEYSKEYEFRTAAAVPQAVRAPRCTDAGGVLRTADAGAEAAKPEWLAAVHVEWQHSRNTFNDPVDYVLQMHGPRATEFKQIYRGRDNHFRVHGLQPGSEYTFRVCPVRCATARPTTSTTTTRRSGAKRRPATSAENSSGIHQNGSHQLDTSVSNGDCVGNSLSAVADKLHDGDQRSAAASFAASGSDTDSDADAELHNGTVDHMGAYSPAVRHTPSAPNAGDAIDSTDGGPLGHSAAGGGHADAGGDHQHGQLHRLESGPRVWLRWAMRRFWAHCRGDDRLPETEHACFMMVMFLLFCLFCTGVVRFGLAVRAGKI